jgi:tetratricopeptide (TPR) repeat protein
VKKSQGLSRNFSILLLALLVLGAPQAWSHGGDAENSAWAHHVRKVRGWASGFSITEEALGRELEARRGLKREPDSRELKRDLADALHTLGHMAEENQDFQRAMKHHREALKLFKESGLPTKESWDDGVAHAQEHIFVDLYDMGEHDKAYQWTEETKLASSSANRSERFVPRYMRLLKDRKAQMKELSAVAVRSLGNLCQYMLERRVIEEMMNLFGGRRAG